MTFRSVRSPFYPAFQKKKKEESKRKGKKSSRTAEASPGPTKTAPPLPLPRSRRHEKRAKRGGRSEAWTTEASEAAVAAAAMATTMTAKRGPSDGEMRGSGGRARTCPVEGGEACHPSAAELRASLSTRDQVRACSGVPCAHARALQCRLLLTWRIGAMVVFVWFGLVVYGAHAC